MAKYVIINTDNTIKSRKMSEIEEYNKKIRMLKKRKVKLMCKPLEKIRGKSADEILKLVGISDEVPMPLDPILEYFNISANPFDFTSIESLDGMVDVVKKRGNILGMIMSKDDHAGIFYRHSDTPHRQRFTIAHELGHCALADGLIEEFIEFRHDEASEDPLEVAVNIFAGELLIPKKSLLNLYEAMKIPCTCLLSELFGVSQNVMRERMKVLGLTHV